VIAAVAFANGITFRPFPGVRDQRELAGGVQLVTALSALHRSSGTPPDRLLIASFDLKQLNVREADAETFYAQLLARVSRLPGVQAAGLAPARAVWTFHRGKGRDNSVVVWRPADGPREGTVPLGGYAAGHLIEALGLQVLQGRSFTDDDRRASRPQVAVVNRPFADQILEGQALGATLRVAARGQPYTAATEVRVVGVIEAAQEPSYVRDPPYAVPTIYLPAPLEPAYALALYLRANESAAVAPLVRDVVRQIDPRVPILQLESLAQADERIFLAENTLARATAILGLIALFLATWGLYGVVSYMVTLRSREIAVRLALGARPSTILRMVLSNAMTPAALGAAVGAAAAIVIGRVIQSEVHAPGGVNPAAIAWPAAGMIAVMLAASALPAARAGRVNLLQLLKEN
jgi:putative ABC transport system permease protein